MDIGSIIASLSALGMVCLTVVKVFKVVYETDERVDEKPEEKEGI